MTAINADILRTPVIIKIVKILEFSNPIIYPKISKALEVALINCQKSFQGCVYLTNINETMKTTTTPQTSGHGSLKLELRPWKSFRIKSIFSMQSQSVKTRVKLT